MSSRRAEVVEQACEVGRGLLVEYCFNNDDDDDVELYLLCDEEPVQVLEEGDHLVEVYCGV